MIIKVIAKEKPNQARIRKKLNPKASNQLSFTKEIARLNTFIPLYCSKIFNSLSNNTSELYIFSFLKLFIPKIIL